MFVTCRPPSGSESPTVHLVHSFSNVKSSMIIDGKRQGRARERERDLLINVVNEERRKRKEKMRRPNDDCSCSAAKDEAII